MGTQKITANTYRTTGVPAALDEFCPEVQAPDAFTQIGRLHATYARARLGLLVGGNPYLERIDRWMEDPGAPPLLVTGAPGSGKGTVMAHWVQAWHRSHPDDIVFAHYLGASPDSADPIRLMQRLLDHLDLATGGTAGPPTSEVELMEWAGQLAQRLATAALYAEQRGSRVIIALDGLDKLPSELNLRWLPAVLAPNVKLLTSSLAGDAQHAALACGWRTIEVAPLDEAGKRELISSRFQSWGLKLQDLRLEQVLGCPLSGSPLFLKTVLNELRASALQKVPKLRLDRYLEAPDMSGLFARVLEHLEEDCTEPLVRRALSLIWASRAGLEEEEIIALAEATPLSWTRLRNCLGDALRKQAGRITFNHDVLRQAVAQRYLSTHDARAQVHLQIAARFQTHAPDARQAEELSYQLSRGQAWEPLEALLVDLDRFTLLLDLGFGELLGYWRQLGERGRDVEALLCEAFQRRAGEPHSWTQRDIELAFLIHHFLSYSKALGEPALRLIEKRTRACEQQRRPAHTVTHAGMNDLAVILVDRGDLERAQKLEARVLEFPQPPGLQHPVRLAAMNKLALKLRDRGDLKAAQQRREPALDTLENMNNLASILTGRGDLEVAQKREARMSEARAQLLDTENGDNLTLMSDLANTLAGHGDFEGAQRLQERVLQAQTRLLGPEHPDTLTSMHHLADTLSDRGDLEAAQKLQECALETQARLAGPAHPDTLKYLSALIGIFYLRGDLKGAQKLCGRVLEAHARLPGTERIRTLGTMSGLAFTLGMLGDREGARKLFERVLKSQTQLLGPEHPNTITTTIFLGATLGGLGDLQRAQELQERALEAQTRLLGPEHPDTLAGMSALAITLGARGNLERAQKLQECVLEAQTRLLGPEHPDTLTSMNRLADTLLTRGDLQGPYKLMRGVLEARTRTLGPQHPDTLQSASLVVFLKGRLQ